MVLKKKYMPEETKLTLSFQDHSYLCGKNLHM